MDNNSRIMDIYEYAERISKQIPIDYIFGLLNISEQKFVDILNENCHSKKHLITNYEEKFRFERELFGKNIFTKNYVFGLDSDLSVELADFEDWLDDNYELLKENRVVHIEETSRHEDEAVKGQIAELEAENSKLRDRIAELENVARAAEESVKKDDPREVNSLLKIIDACLALGKEPRDRNLVGKIARKVELLYEDGKLSEKTIRDKINKINRLK